MSHLNLHCARPTTRAPLEGSADAVPQQAGTAPLPPLLVNIDGLAALLSRSAPSLQRDDAAGRLPAALRIGGSKRWRYSEIVAWVEAGCPDRKTWQALSNNRR